MRFSFVDVETTGLDPATASIVELAIVTTDESGRVLDRYETMLNPLGRMAATRIHGIKAAHVMSAPTFELVAAEVAERLDGTVLVAYNAPFDEPFLTRAMSSVGGRIRGQWVCALDHARASQRQFDRYRLTDVARGLGIQGTYSEHSALGDAEICRGAFFALGECRQSLRPVKAQVATPYRVPPMPRSAADGHGTSRRPVALERSLARTGVDVSSVADTLHEAFADGAVTLAEVKGVAAACAALEMTAGDLLSAFNRFLDEALAAVLADGQVDNGERQLLRVISHHLGFPAPYIERRLVGEASATLMALPLQPGLNVVLTNVDDDREWEIGRAATAQGLCIRHGVSKTTDLVVHSGPPSTTKAAKAVELGIPLMPLAEFERALRGKGRGRRAAQVEASYGETGIVSGGDLVDGSGVEALGGRRRGTLGSMLRRLFRARENVA